MIAWGGGSAAAARRAGRHGIGFLAQGGGSELRDVYESSARNAGHQPSMCYVPDPDTPMTMFVSDDLDRAWEELGPYLMHDVLSYAEWNEGNADTASLSFVSTAEELRAENRSHRIFSVDEAIEFVRGGAPLALHPLIGGLPPEVAWRYLRTAVDEVMPAVAS
jgi:alkanesulfonate monooxygenase SsuD/methylene tetrahydromethanopterin reductase-like flavin-dependent oxidoreductase (luciferase family)